MLVMHCEEYSMSRRLFSLLLSVMKTYEGNLPGKRDVVKGQLIALQGFELNTHLSYKKIFKKDVDIEVQKR